MSIWIPESSGKIRCKLCPRNCLIAKGEVGFCQVRANVEGRMELLVMERPAAVAIDPIEKKPLYHFYPGSEILSIGTQGCNLKCQFCQNWHLSRASAEEHPVFDSTDLIALAKKQECVGLAYTYNEPIIFHEYVKKVARLARIEQLKNVVVTAGYISAGARDLFFENIDAANVDLKAFDEHFYRKFCDGRLSVILDTLLYIRERSDIWLEVTNLIIPGLNDDEQKLDQMCKWISKNLGAETPLHFSAFYPAYRVTDRLRTPLETLSRAREIASSYGLKHIYLGNVGEMGNIHCASCNGSCGDDGVCSSCGKIASGHFLARNCD